MLRLADVGVLYRRRRGEIRALDGVSLEIAAGEFATVSGPSGSGKSTFALVCGGLLRPTSGTVEFRGEPLGALNDTRLSDLRNRHIGYVFQAFNLLPALTALENVALGLVLRGTPRRTREELAREVLAQLGLAARASHFPAELSGGECQRVALARTLVSGTDVVIADEPTGNLDRANRELVLECFRAIHRRGDRALVVVTHDEELAAAGSRRIRLEEGRLA